MPVEKIGDWEKVAAVCLGLSGRFEKAMHRATVITGEKIEAAILKHIQEQDLPWAKLSDRYLKLKMVKFGQPNIYILTSTFLQNITTSIEGTQGFVGVLRGSKDPDGQDYTKIGYVLEYGYIENNLPPRPLWRPTFLQMTPEVKRIYEQALNDVLGTK